MAQCQKCGKSASWLSLRDGTYCAPCFDGMREEKERQQERETADADLVASKIILTTETAHNLPVAERIDIITAECVIGMHLFKDVASAFRDVFGGRSKAMQDGLREARKTALLELRKEAAAVGADAVVGVDLDYSEISGGGKSMLFLVASGTAVKLQS